MRCLAAIAAVALFAGQAHAEGPYKDSATSAWFKGLQVYSTDSGQDVGCCDQSDCHETNAVWQDGGWWAESRLYKGEWVRVPAANVVNQPNPTMNAVLCEARGGLPSFRQVTVPGGKDDWLYCFVPPPLGF